MGRIVERCVQAAGPPSVRLGTPRRSGIDEICYRRHHRYLTVVLDHDSGLLLWAAPRRDEATLRRFTDLLGEERAKRIELVPADGTSWIANVVAERRPNATLCLDPFHVVSWGTGALDEVRRDVWNAAGRAGQRALGRELKGARFALSKNPEDLTAHQQTTLAAVARTNRPLHRAYLLKEQLRQVFQLRGTEALALLGHWLGWARRSRLRPFVELARSIASYLSAIAAALTHGLSNARVESLNTKIRLIARRAFGFHSPEALIALAMLGLGGLCPPLPGRAS